MASAPEARRSLGMRHFHFTIAGFRRPRTTETTERMDAADSVPSVRLILSVVQPML